MIGVFDSGVGGLSVLRAIRDALPAESLVYVADSAHAPYGDRDAGFIAGRAAEITRFLLSRGVKAIVVACNTATVVAVHALRTWCPVPIVGIEPAIKPGAMHTKSGVIGVLATTRTLASTSVDRLCRIHAAHVDVRLVACPGLAERVETGDLSGEATRALLLRYVAPLLDAGADTIVLGCTHYPFLADTLREIVGPRVSLIDPAAAVARELARRIGRAQQAASAGAAGATLFFSSGSPQGMRTVASMLWGSPVEVRGLPVGDRAQGRAG